MEMVIANDGSRVITVIKNPTKQINYNSMNKKRKIFLLLDIINDFITLKNIYKENARQLEELLLDLYPNNLQFQELMDVLALYEPGGGEYLLDEKDLNAKLESVLPIIRQDLIE